MSPCLPSWSWMQSLVLLVLLSSVVRSQPECHQLNRDVRICPAKTWAQEYICMAQQNTMLSLMGCVVQFHNQDMRVCRSTDPRDKKFDNWEDPNKTIGEECLSPRDVLLYNSKNICPDCLLTGALQRCPKDDPLFVNCLCEQGAALRHFQCFAECFWNDGKTGLSPLCQNPSKRDQLIDAGSNITTTNVAEPRAQPTSYPPVTFNTAYWQSQALPPLSFSSPVPDATSPTALMVCTVDPMRPIKYCNYVTNRTAVSTNSNHYIRPSEPTGLSHEPQVTFSPTGSPSVPSETARLPESTPKSAAHVVSASTSAMMGILMLALFLVT